MSNPCRQFVCRDFLFLSTFAVHLFQGDILWTSNGPSLVIPYICLIFRLYFNKGNIRMKRSISLYYLFTFILKLHEVFNRRASKEIFSDLDSKT